MTISGNSASGHCSPAQVIRFSLYSGILLICVLQAGCDPHDTTRDKEFHVSHSSLPFLFVYRYPAFMRKSPSGLVAAVWPDARVVRAESEEGVGSSYHEGVLADHHMKHLLSLVQRTLSNESIRRHDEVATDHAFEVLWIRDKQQLVGIFQPLLRNSPRPIHEIKTFLSSVEFEELTEVDGSWKGLPPPEEWLDGSGEQ